MPTTKKLVSTTELAEELETDPRTLRRFLRSEASPVETVGKGKRYVLDTPTVKLIRKQFAAWLDTKGNNTTALKDAVPAARSGSKS